MKTKNKVGRPPVADKGKNRSIKLTDDQYTAFKLQGGIKWLKSHLAPIVENIKLTVDQGE
jgi:hypothetical protein